MKVNGKDDIPYMKWKIKFMFETTNQNMSLAKEPCCDSIDCFAGIAAIAVRVQLKPVQKCWKTQPSKQVRTWKNGELIQWTNHQTSSGFFSSITWLPDQNVDLSTI